MCCCGLVRSVGGVGGVGRSGGGSVVAVVRWGLSVVSRWSVSVVGGVVGQSVGPVGRLVGWFVGRSAVGQSVGLWGRSVRRLVGRSAVCMVGRRLWGRSVGWLVGRSVERVGRSVCSGSDGGQLEGLR